MSCTISDEAIMELVKDRGILKYTMLMLKFHISSVEAQRIVKDYVSRGIIDEDGSQVSKESVPEKSAEERANTSENNPAANISMHQDTNGQLTFF